MVIEPPSQGIIGCIPYKKAHFFTLPLPFPTSLRNSWVGGEVRTCRGATTEGQEVCLHHVKRVCRIMPCESYSQTTSTATQVPRKMQESKRADGAFRRSGFLPTPRQAISIWTRHGWRAGARCANDGYNAEPFNCRSTILTS